MTTPDIPCAQPAPLPCPFCGSDELSFFAGSPIRPAAIICNDCACDMPGADHADALASWNRRDPAPEGGQPTDAQTLELAAKAVYQLFIGADDHPWVEDGNSLMQCDARRYAWAALAAQPLMFNGDLAAEVERLKAQNRDVAWMIVNNDQDGAVQWAKGLTTSLEDEMEVRAQSPAEGDEVARLRQALKFYADGDHFTKHQPDAWDTVSGEPSNFYEDEAATATVEDGSVAKAALEGIELQDEHGLPVDAAFNALRELVALKDMKARLQSLHEMGHGTDYTEYHRRKPAAWEVARALLSSPSAKPNVQPKGLAAVRSQLNRFIVEPGKSWIYDHLDQADVIIRIDGDFDSEADREQYVNALAARLQAPAPEHEPATVESAAKAVFQKLPGWCGQPWVEGGNSLKQDEARRYARVALAAVPCAAVGAAWTPTADNINALPAPVRAYVHALAANCDPAGTVADNTVKADQIRGLQASNRRIRDELDTPGNRWPEARYAGYTGQPYDSDYTADQAAAFNEGQRARVGTASNVPVQHQEQQP